MAERTVRAHVTSIVRKLELGSRFEAGLVAFHSRT
ncbi:LuxR C-terminal-related transcriptional regulator [Streptomyces sp. NPDC004135]